MILARDLGLHKLDVRYITYIACILQRLRQWGLKYNYKALYILDN
jgi:hypothetical protein